MGPPSQSDPRLSEEAFSIPDSDLDIFNDVIDLGEEKPAKKTKELRAGKHIPTTIKPPKVIQRPTSSGTASIIADFQFSVAPKTKPKLTRPPKDNEINGPNTLTTPEEVQDENGGQESTRRPGAECQSSIPPKSTISPDEELETDTRDVDRQVSARNGEGSSGSNIEQLRIEKPADRVQGSISTLEVRPRALFQVPDTHETTSSATVIGSLNNLSPDHQENARTPLSGQSPIDNHEEGLCVSSGQIQSPQAPTSSDLKLPRSMHTVLAGRVNKPKSSKDGQRNPHIPSLLGSLDKCNLPTDQILHVYLQRVHTEKEHTVRRNRDMKQQIEQLVRINNDYQRRLGEVEQDLDDREAQIREQSAEVQQWRQQILHFQETLKEVKKGHGDLRFAMDALKQNSKGLPTDLKDLQTSIRQCSANTCSLETRTSTSLRSTAQAHKDQVLSMEADLKVIKKDLTNRNSQLTKEQAKVARLENFIMEELRSMGTNVALVNEDFKPIATRLRSLETVLENVTKQATTRPKEVNFDLSKIDQCLDLLKTISGNESGQPLNLQPVMTAIGLIEEKLTDCIQMTQQCSETTGGVTSQLEMELKKQAGEIKNTVSAMVLSLSDKYQLEKENVQHAEMAKGYLNSLTQVQKALEFAQHQANIPQAMLRDLSVQLADFKGAAFTEASKVDEQKKRIIEDGRKIQNLNSRLEEEKSTVMALKKSSESQSQDLSQKEKELEELKKSQAEVKADLRQAQDRAEKVPALENEVQRLKNADTVQRHATEELQTKLNAMEATQKQLDLVMQEKTELALKITQYEQRLKDQEALQEKCDSLSGISRLFEDQKTELRDSIEQNTSLKDILARKEEEITQLRGKLDAAQKSMDQAKAVICTGSSQEIPETISQDNLTPGTLAAFQQLIDPNMLDGNVFQSFDSEPSRQVKSNIGPDMPMRKANRCVREETQAENRRASQSSRSTAPFASQQTSLIPDSQPTPIETHVNNGPDSLDRSSSLTPLSDVESLFEAVIQGAKTREPDIQGTKPSSTKNARSMNSIQSDEMLLESNPGQREDASGRRGNRRRNPAVEGKDVRSSSDQSVTSPADKRASKALDTSLRRVQASSTARTAAKSGYSPSKRPLQKHSTIQDTLSSDARLPLGELDKNLNTGVSDSMTKEKPRPNSAAKRQASSIEASSSPQRSGAKRIKHDHSAVEGKERDKSSSNGNRTAPTVSPTRPILRQSLPTGSKGSGNRSSIPTNPSSQTRGSKKRSRSQAYNERFGQ